MGHLRWRIRIKFLVLLAWGAFFGGEHFFVLLPRGAIFGLTGTGASFWSCWHGKTIFGPTDTKSNFWSYWHGRTVFGPTGTGRGEFLLLPNTGNESGARYRALMA